MYKAIFLFYSSDLFFVHDYIMISLKNHLDLSNPDPSFFLIEYFVDDLIIAKIPICTFLYSFKPAIVTTFTYIKIFTVHEKKKSVTTQITSTCNQVVQKWLFSVGI